MNLRQTNEDVMLNTNLKENIRLIKGQIKSLSLLIKALELNNVDAGHYRQQQKLFSITLSHLVDKYDRSLNDETQEFNILQFPNIRGAA